MAKDRMKYGTVSIPQAINSEIDNLIDELGYWPSRSAFVREACLEKIHRERQRLRELREATEDTRSARGEEPRRGTKPGDQPPLNGPERSGPDSSPK
jgi:Arc/MetJ-type ribon-helix-helix transcriptional regulator